jgi:hypothetical protein
MLDEAGSPPAYSEREAIDEEAANPMLRNHRALHYLALLLVPPFLAAGIAHWAYVLSGGEARCFASLDLATPGLVCEPGVVLLLNGFFWIAAHLVVGIPAALLLGHLLMNHSVRVRRTKRALVSALSLLLFAEIILIVLLARAGVSAAADVVATLALPGALGLATALILRAAQPITVQTAGV